MKTKRKLFILLLAVMMVVTMMPLGASQGYAASGSGNSDYDTIMKNFIPDCFKNPDFEPYGFGKDVPFLMNEQSELLLYMTNKDSSGKITTIFDKIKSESTGDLINNATKTTAIETPPIALKKASFVKAVALDPRGCGRKDHIAFIGVNSTKAAYIWVYDTRNKKWSDGVGLDDCGWLKKLSYYEAINFLSITAGDYDGDGKDSIIAYIAADYYSSGFKGDDLKEYQVNTPDIGSSGKISLDLSGMSHSFVWSEKFINGDYDQDSKHKLGVDLDTGDINGDGIDDLVTVCYYGNADNNNQKASLYRPWLCVFYGNKTNNFIGNTSPGSKFGLWEGYKDESDDAIKNKNWKSLVSPSIACGDIDNDGVDEIVAAGVKNTIHANGAANAGDPADLNSEKISVYIIDGGKMIQKEVSANKWTSKGFYDDDDAWNKTATECVAVNGLGNPEMIFISGTLYDYDKESSNLTAVHTPDYFNDTDDGLNFKLTSNMYVQSAVAGNFDSNDKGFEQVVYTVNCKTAGANEENYDYLIGVIGGKNRNKNSGIASEYYSTSVNSMKNDHSYPTLDDGSNYYGGVENDCGLNCIAVAVDNDNDGMMARYKDKTLTYADPDIVCILQAAPYFKELDDHISVVGETTYQIQNEYSFERSSSTSSSFSVGGSMKLGTPACEIEVQAGYAREWEKEFTEGHITTEAFHWTAEDKDQVVVYRTPVICYRYQVQDQQGNWEKDGVENSWVISVPSDPSYTPLDIDQYNAFAKYYNKETAKKTSDFRKLEILDNKYLGVEGEPDKYLSIADSRFHKGGSGYELIQSSLQTVGHTSGSTGWSLEKGTSSSVTESMSYGFTFGASVAVGPDLGPVSFSVGVTTALENMSGESTTESTATTNGISCSVRNIDSSKLPSNINGDLFSFSYKMATWPSGIKRYVTDDKSESIPVFGYALAGVANPIKQSNLTPEEIEALPVIELLDQYKDSSVITLDDEDEIIYIRDEYEKLSEEAKKLINITILIEAEKKIETIKEYESGQPMNIDGWVIGLSKTSFTYNGKVQKPVVKSIWGFELKEGEDYDLSWSNESSKNAGTYTVQATGKGRYSGVATAEYKILPKKITPSVTLSTKTYTFNGKVRKPTVTVKNGTTKLSSSNYKVTYGPGRKSIGKYEVKVTMKGNYSGTKSVYFSIIPKGTTISSITPASKSITVKWKKQATRMATFRIQGYQIQIATNSSFTKGADKWVAYGYSKTSKKLTGLKPGKKYYVRIRTFKGVNGVKYFSKWSKVKTVTTKK